LGASEIALSASRTTASSRWNVLSATPAGSGSSSNDAMKGIDDRRQQSVDGAMLRIGPRKFIRHLLKGDVGPKTRMLMRKPAMQLNHVVSSSVREKKQPLLLRKPC
jgi:hypothetical protein